MRTKTPTNQTQKAQKEKKNSRRKRRTYTVNNQNYLLHHKTGKQTKGQQITQLWFAEGGQRKIVDGW
jgi:hypothetical protein